MSQAKTKKIKVLVLQIVTALFPFAQAAFLFFGVPCLLDRVKKMGADLPLSTMILIKQREMWWSLVIAGICYVLLLKLSPKFKNMKLLLGILVFELLWIGFDLYAACLPICYKP